MSPPPCPICVNDRSPYFQATILHRYTVDYFYCVACGLLQTEAPYWLEESYANPIALADTGIMQRNLITAEKLACILMSLWEQPAKGRYVDIGGGYGILVRLMRDIGFDFYWFDPYCQNLVATGFEATDEIAPAQAITAFEVLEHVYDPIPFLQQMLQRFATGTVIMTTEVFAGTPPAPTEWDYYALSSGQHVSLYQRRTLVHLAAQLGLRCYSYRNFHIFTDRTLSRWRFRLAISKLSALYYRAIVRPRLQTRQFSDSQLLSNYATQQC